MSFALNLWDNFELVNQHSIDRRKSGEDFLSILRDLAGHYENYARGMDRIGSHSFFATSQGTLFHGISALKNDSLNKAMQSRILAESIINDLIEPMRELLKNQTIIIKKTSTEGKKLEKDHQSLIENYNKGKTRYIRACQECEQVIISLEYSMPQDKRQRLLSRLVSCKKEVDISLKQYQESVETGNNYRIRYQSLMQKILEVYQKQEEQRLEHMKDSLRKLIVYETSYLRNLQYDIDNLAHSMESINIRSDIRQFVDENTTGKERLPLFEFVPYSGTHPSFKNLGTNPPMATVSFPVDQQDGVMNTVKRWVDRVVPQQHENDIRLVLDALIEKSWRGEELETPEKATISMLIRERIGRKAWIWALNQRRTIGSFELPAAGFIIIGEMMKEILTECIRSRDAAAGKSIIILSQTFHRERVDMNDSRVYLHSLILDHELWKDLTYWEDIILTSIEEDFKMHEDYGIGDDEEKEEQVKRLKNIVFCQIGSYSHIMLSFNVENKYVGELVSKYACRYDLSSSDMDTLLVRYKQATVNKTYAKKPELEVCTDVQRGIPKWIEDLHDSTAHFAMKIKPKEVPMSPITQPDLIFDTDFTSETKPELLINPDNSS